MRDALQQVRATNMKVLEYSPAIGLASYRKKLVDYYHKFQINLSPDEIIVTTGASEAIQFAFLSCLDHRDEVIVPEITWIAESAPIPSHVVIARPGLDPALVAGIIVSGLAEGRRELPADIFLSA